MARVHKHLASAVHVTAILLAGLASSGVAQIDLPPSLTAFLEEQAEQERLDIAITELSQKIDATPDDMSLLLERAERYTEAGDLEATRADLERAMALAPNSAEALHRAAIIMAGIAPLEAIPLFDKLVEITDGDAGALADRGKAYGLSGNHEQALADLDAALAKDPHLALAHAMRGNIYLSRNEHQAAVDAFTAALALTPIAQAYFDRGYCYKQMGNYPAAIADYTDAARLDSENIGPICERGQVHQLSGNYAAALRDYDRCLTEVPDDPGASLQLAWLLATCPDDALRDGKRALRLASNVCDAVTCQTPEPLNALAAAYAEMGDYRRAETLQERAVALSIIWPDFQQESATRLQNIRDQQPIRDALTPLRIQPRDVDALPRAVALEEAMNIPADVLGRMYLETQTALQLANIAKAGASIETSFDGQPGTVNSGNASDVEERLLQRQQVFTEAIKRRGIPKLAEGYTAIVTGDCDNWAMGNMPVLFAQHLEQGSPACTMTQATLQHNAVAVESAVVFRHDLNVDFTISGTIDDEGRITFLTAGRGGIFGTAEGRCTLTLTPAKVEGSAFAEAYAGRAVACRESGGDAVAIAALNRAFELHPQPEYLAMKAITLATSQDETVRSGAQALEAALHAQSLVTDEARLITLQALVVAHAETGDFPKAATFQRELLRIAPEDVREIATEHLEMLEAGQPFHNEPW
jgi:tetratricopeptide (TPR) repeat protein